MECVSCDGVLTHLTNGSFAFCVGEQSDRSWVDPTTTEGVLQYFE